MSNMEKYKSDNFGYARYNSEVIITSGAYHFWMFRRQKRFGNLKEIEKLRHLVGDFENMQKECVNLRNLKNVDGFAEEKG